MSPVTRADIANGAAMLELGPDGVPRDVLTVVDLDTAPAGPPPRGRGGVIVGVGPSTADDSWLTTVAAPEDLTAIEATVYAAPRASLVLAGLLEMTARFTVEDGLLSESLAYSVLLAGPEFAAWRARTPRRPLVADAEPVLVTRDDDLLTITLNRPARHNAFSRQIRDGLLEGLAVAHADPAVSVLIRGAGRSFSSGGDLDEFGTADDVSTAHLIRLRHSAAYAVHAIRERVQVTLHGACIGAGIEVPSFAGLVAARDDACFRLPELSMGLVPGAGGTVGITRRIGRWRTALLALTGQPIDIERALEWGLVDERA